MAGAGLGLLSPYIGAGLGWQNFSIESRILDQVDIDLPEEFDEDENAAKYYGVIGAAVTPVPLLRPFIEYRYAGITRDNLGPGSHGTWVFGVQLRF
jgi:opacity protein-like surface antigen